MLNTCNNCTHWKEGGEGDYRTLIGAGKCKRVGQFWDSTEWSSVENEDFGVDVIRAVKSTDDLAFVQDGSDYHADLITLPLFGCAMFEDKDE